MYFIFNVSLLQMFNKWRMIKEQVHPTNPNVLFKSALAHQGLFYLQFVCKGQSESTFIIKNSPIPPHSRTCTSLRNRGYGARKCGGNRVPSLIVSQKGEAVDIMCWQLGQTNLRLMRFINNFSTSEHPVLCLYEISRRMEKNGIKKQSIFGIVLQYMICKIEMQNRIRFSEHVIFL